MAGTTAFAIKQDLVTKITDAPAFAGIDVWYGYQGGASGDFPRKVVWIGEIQWDYERPASLGNLKREESYDIVLTIQVSEPGFSQQEANAAVETLLQAVEVILKDPHWTAVPGIVSSGIVPRLLNEGTTDTGRAAILITTVQVTARK
jgi:hypothetical protein